MRTKDKLKSLINKKVKDGLTDVRFETTEYPNISSSHEDRKVYTHYADPKAALRLMQSKHPDKYNKKQIQNIGRKYREGTSMNKPTLWVNGKGEVTGHEGRHRLRAAIQNGIKMVPINISPQYEDNKRVDHKFEDLKGQFESPDEKRREAYSRKLAREGQNKKIDYVKEAEKQRKIRQGMESLKAIDKLKAILNKDENKINDEYHKVMEEAAKERKGSYDRNTSTYHKQDGSPSWEHCGATSTVLERMGRGKKVEGTYHGTLDGNPAEHSWVEDDKGNIIDASRDQFHGRHQKGIHTITPDHPHYKHYKKNPPCESCGSTSPRKNYTNLYSFCSGENCRNMKDKAPEEFEKFYGRKHKNIKELSAFRKQAEKELNMAYGHTQKSKSIDKLKAILNKDALDGKQSNRGKKRKPTNWVPNNDDEKKEEWTHMKPEDFLDVAVGYPSSDAHARTRPDTREIQDPKTGKFVKHKPKRWSVPNPEQYKKPYTKEDEEYGKTTEGSWNRRGDELGGVERYQRAIRHGRPIAAPALQVSNNRVIEHEGRHRAEAARREGEKTIPVGIGSRLLRTGHEKKRNKKQIQNLHGQIDLLGGQLDSPRVERERVTAGMKGLNKLKALINKEVKDGLWQGRFANITGVGGHMRKDRKQDPKKDIIERKPDGSIDRDAMRTWYVDPTEFYKKIEDGANEDYVKERAHQMQTDDKHSAVKIPDILVRGDGRINHHEGRHEMNAAARAGIRSMPVRVSPTSYNRKEPSSLKRRKIDPNNPNLIPAERRSEGRKVELHPKTLDRMTTWKKREEAPKTKERVREGMESLKSIDKLKALINKEVKDGVFQGKFYSEQFRNASNKKEARSLGQRQRHYMNTEDAIKLIDDPINEDHVNRQAEELKKPNANAKMTSVTVDPKGRISHKDGRHTLHALHRAGVKVVPIQVNENDQKEHPKRLSNIKLTNPNLVSEKLGRDYKRPKTKERENDKEWNELSRYLELYDDKIREGMESLKSIDKLKALINKKVEMDTRNSKQQPDRNASDDEGSHTWYAMIEPEKQIPPSRVAGTAGSHPIHNKKDKIRSEFSQHRADRLPKTDVVDAETGDVIGEVSDDSGEYPEFHHERSISPNVAHKLKAIDKLKAMSLLSITLKEGETNSGEKSHIKDSKRKEKETQTPDNYDNREYTTNWRKHDIDDRDQDDKDYYYN